MRTPRLTALCLCFGLVGCGSSAKNAADKQFDALHAEIAKVQADQSRLSERIGGLESDLARKKAAEERGAAVTERPPLKVVVLRPDTDDRHDEAEPAPGDEEAERTTVQARGKGDYGTAVKGKKAKPGDADKELDGALAQLKKKSLSKAVEALTGFLVKNPGHPRAEEAMFKLGEAYAAQGDHARAIEHLDAALARFPSSTRAPDALLALARMQKRAGDGERSQKTLADLKTRFPDSDAAKRAAKE
ncbi:MAG: tetratricopeptide repeat protein [Polyangiaceae bacterium]|nr:tetratricopeptide repeat protein [Polyangiaceae bacterium]